MFTAPSVTLTDRSCSIFRKRDPPKEALSEQLVKELDRQRFTYTQSIV